LISAKLIGHLPIAAMRQLAGKRPVMAVACDAAEARAIPAHHQSIAVVFDLMNPERAGRRLGRLRSQARFDAP